MTHVILLLCRNKDVLYRNEKDERGIVEPLQS